MNNRMDATVALASEQTIVEISDADVEEYVFAVKLVKQMIMSQICQ